MKMKLVLRSLAACAVLAVGATPAFAQLTMPPQPPPGPGNNPSSGDGGLYLYAYDSTAGTSLTYYLGFTFSQLTDANLSAQSLDFGVLAGFSTAFGSSTTGNIRYHVTAGDLMNTGGSTFAGQGLATTFGTAPGPIRNSAMRNALNNVQEFNANRVNSPAGCSGANPCTAPNASSPQYAGLLGDQLNNPLDPSAPALPVANTGVVGAALQFFLLQGNGTNAISNTNQTQYATALNGRWLLDAAGRLQWLVDVGTPAVPLPAAVWLLLSGLAGCAVVGRRRAAAPAAA